MPDNKEFGNGANLHKQPPGRLFRNRRTVWSIAPAQFKEAHFATFPIRLIEPCVLTGCPPQVCEHCGAGWQRVVERVKADVTRPRPFSQIDNHDRNDTSRIYEETQAKTIGWQPGCNCPDNTGSQSGVVLDPFFGTGTVGEVAITHRRNWLGIELNPAYIALAQERLDGLQVRLF